jgi:hypothetical protein
VRVEVYRRRYSEDAGDKEKSARRTVDGQRKFIRRGTLGVFGHSRVDAILLIANFISRGGAT